MSLTERQKQAQKAGQAAMRRATGRDGYFTVVLEVSNAVAAQYRQLEDAE